VNSAAEAVTAKLKAAGIRAHLDNRSDTLNYRIRDGEVTRVPYMAVIGKREADSGTVAIRVRGAGKKQDIVAVDDFVARVVREKKERALVP
jgi:threonyl-tRNA synthetase